MCEKNFPMSSSCLPFCPRSLMKITLERFVLSYIKDTVPHDEIKIQAETAFK
jgi:hypothetical protein